MYKYLSILRINWIQALEYRGNAYIGLFAIISGLFIEYQIWSLIFDSKNMATIVIEGSTDGYNFNQLIVFIFLSIIVGQLKSSWMTSSQMIVEIRQGLINKYLIRPISYFWYNFMMFIGVNSIYYIVYTLLLLLFIFIYPDMLFQNNFSIIGFFITLIISIYISYCIYFIMACFAFWFGEVRSIVVAYNLGMLMISGQYMPIRLFPKEVLNILQWTPIPYLVDFPVSIATGLVLITNSIDKIILSLFWCVVLTVLSKIIYNFGIRQYEAYGQ